jgi:hypothetical protein
MQHTSISTQHNVAWVVDLSAKLSMRASAVHANMDLSARYANKHAHNGLPRGPLASGHSSKDRQVLITVELQSERSVPPRGATGVELPPKTQPKEDSQQQRKLPKAPTSQWRPEKFTAFSGRRSITPSRGRSGEVNALSGRRSFTPSRGRSSSTSTSTM